MNICIMGPDLDGYSVSVDGEICLECLPESEIKKLTLGEILMLEQGKEK